MRSTMRLARSLALLPVLAAVFASPVLGQQRTDTASRPTGRGYVTGIGGLSIDPEAPTIAVEYGESLGRRVQAYANFSYFDDVMQDTSHDYLDELGDLMTITTGLPWQFDGRDRAFAFSAGAKYLVQAGGTVYPYVGGGMGLINLKRTVTERSFGEVTAPFLAQFREAEGVFSSGELSTTKPLGELSVGAAIVAGQTYVDIGYRLRRVFHSPESLTFGQFCIGVGMKF